MLCTWIVLQRWVRSRIHAYGIEFSYLFFLLYGGGVEKDGEEGEMVCSSRLISACAYSCVFRSSPSCSVVLKKTRRKISHRGDIFGRMQRLRIHFFGIRNVNEDIGFGVVWLLGRRPRPPLRRSETGGFANFAGSRRTSSNRLRARTAGMMIICLT